MKRDIRQAKNGLEKSVYCVVDHAIYNLVLVILWHWLWGSSICMFSVRSCVINFVEGWYCRRGCRMRILYCVCVVETVGLCCAFIETEGIVKSLSLLLFLNCI